MPRPELLEPVLFEGQAHDPSARMFCSSGWRSPCSPPAVTCSLRASRGWPRRSRSSPLAGAIGGQFQRIQFTPDLVPADLVGTRSSTSRTGEFEVSLGPVSPICCWPTRSTAPRQGAKRIARSDAGATGDHGRETFPVPEPFLVMATQNPIESDGTTREAQVDRFMMKVLVGYPTPPEEHAVERALVPPRSAAGDADPGGPDPDAEASRRSTSTRGRRCAVRLVAADRREGSAKATWRST